MKWLYLSLVFLAAPVFAGAQNKDQNNDTIIYTGYKLKSDRVDKNFIQIDGDTPTFDAGLVYPAGIRNNKEFGSYLEKSIKYPPGNDKAVTKYTIVVNFVIEKDGSVTNASVVRRSLNDAMNRQALMLIKNLSKWKAPIYEGKPVRLLYSAPVVVKIQD